MGIFDKIKNAIWGEDAEAKTAAPAPSITPSKLVVSASASAGAEPKPVRPPSEAAATNTSMPPEVVSPNVSGQPVDVAAILDAAVKSSGQKLDWRHSIVDLMKALKLDSSLANRKELADELNYDGDTSKSAAMNMWLHKALMNKLAENGGRVPSELLD